MGAPAPPQLRSPESLKSLECPCTRPQARPNASGRFVFRRRVVSSLPCVLSVPWPKCAPPDWGNGTPGTQWDIWDAWDRRRAPPQITRPYVAALHGWPRPRSSVFQNGLVMGPLPVCHPPVPAGNGGSASDKVPRPVRPARLATPEFVPAPTVRQTPAARPPEQGLDRRPARPETAAAISHSTAGGAPPPVPGFSNTEQHHAGQFVAN